MHATETAQADSPVRLLKSSRGWWCLGAGGGYARLKPHQVGPDGSINPGTERHLREAGLYDHQDRRAYGLTVLTSTDCNLGCGYCFQNTAQDPTGGTRPPRITHSRLTSETIGSVLDFTARRMAEAGQSRLSLLLFGGEPLLNPRGCAELLTRAADLGLVAASMTSNGTLLGPALARQLADAGLTSVQITFDGDRSEHDAIRVRRSGGGTFDTIVANMARCMDVTDLHWSLRVNVSHLNYLGMAELVDRLAAALDTSRCSLYFELVGDVGLGYANNLMRTGEFAALMTQWQIRALEHGFTVRRPQADTPCTFCSAENGRDGAVVNADGTLYSCWETAGKPGWEVGTVGDGYLPSAQTEGRWVACGDDYQYSESRAALAEFRDTVDAALMDHLHATGRL